MNGDSVLSSLDPSSPWTIAGFIKVDDAEYFGKPNGKALSFVDVSSNGHVGIGYNSDNMLKIFSAGNTLGNSGIKLAPNKWYHTALIWDGTKLNAYLNGKFSYSVVPAPNQNTGALLVLDDLDGFQIGNAPSLTQFVNFEGLIDDVRVYDLALSAAEIGEIYDLPEILICTDSDGGLNYPKKGQLVYGDFKDWDDCNGDILNEGYCDDTKDYNGMPLWFKSYNCSQEGRVCINGACTGNVTTTNCDVKIDGVIVKSVYATDRQDCSVQTTFGSQNCNEYVSYFIEGTHLLEQYFDVTDRLNSEYCTCRNGVCDQSENVCTDSDGEKNFYEKGRTYGEGSGKNGIETKVWVDYCMTSDIVYDFKCAITEDSNANPIEVWNDMFTCPNGCFDGACVDESVEKVEKCSDGTLYNECSSKSKPLYCSSKGKIVNNAPLCGCPEGQIQDSLDENICVILFDLSIEPMLWRGNGNHQSAYDILIVTELTEEELMPYLEGSFGDGDFSLFKTNPFIGKEDLFNIYYLNIPSGDYSNSGKCGGKEYPSLPNFDIVFNKFNWVDGKIYVTKNPSLWPHAYFGEAIRISVNCGPWGSINPFSNTMVHEFGHMFGLLWDEYVHGDGSVGFDSINCAYVKGTKERMILNLEDDIGSVEGGKKIGQSTQETEAWLNNQKINRWADIDGYDGTLKLGCSSMYSVRSSVNSIMKNQYTISSQAWLESWFPVNEYYLNQELDKYSGEPLTKTERGPNINGRGVKRR